MFKRLFAGAFTAALFSFSVPSWADDYWHTDFGGPFEMVDSEGQPFTFEDMKGTHSLIYFGYTSCRMQCPPTWINIDRVMKTLTADGMQIRAYFVTIDPDRDTVATMADWQTNWPYTTALTGSREQVENIADAFHIFFAKKPVHAMPFAMDDMRRVREVFGEDERIDWAAERGPDFYMMDHTMQTFMLDPDGKYVTHFEREEDANTITEVIRQLN